MPRVAFVFLLASCAGWCQAASALSIQDNTAVLGKSRVQLESTLPSAQPVRSPRRLPSGALGLLRVSDALCEGAHFEQTLFFKDQQLEAIDMVWLHANSPDTDLTQATASAFTALVQSLRVQLGPELSSAASTQNTVMETAFWVSGDANVILYRSGKTDKPAVRLVVRQRHLVEAGEL